MTSPDAAGAAGRCGARAGTAYAWLRLMRKRPHGSLGVGPFA
ncbi:hypothetical protein [Nostocoides vanveenii]